MKRNIEKNLLLWKEKATRHPLLLKGARQTGKTTLIKNFGLKNFSGVYYLNFENQLDLHSVFNNNTGFNPINILNQLSIICEPLKKNEAAQDLSKDYLWIFDEIQACPRAISSLKYFSEQMPQAHIIAAGSLLGVLSSEESFPVGKIETQYLYPMNFYEFLEAVKGEDWINRLDREFKSNNFFHLSLQSSISPIWQHYLVTGGLPEVVSIYINNQTNLSEAFKLCREKQKNLISDYLSDMAKHAGKLNYMHLKKVWENIPVQLASQNDKFIFKNVIPGKKGFEPLAAPLDWLKNAGLILPCSIINHAQIPLKAFVKINQFKIYLFDIGILAALCDFPIDVLLNLKGENLIYKGFLYENFVMQELIAYHCNPFCWMTDYAEIEFVIQHEGAVVPIEVKSKLNRKARSFASFKKQYHTVNSFLLTPDLGITQEQNFMGILYWLLHQL